MPWMTLSAMNAAKLALATTGDKIASIPPRKMTSPITLFGP